MSAAALLRVAGAAHPHRRRLMVAAGLGAAGAGCAVALTATSAWLITRAAERPPMLHLMIAVVGVRAFGLGRGVLRYVERLAGHDGALRVLAELRARLVERVAAVLPFGDLDVRRGELLSRLAHDVDALVDLWVRVALPYAVAAVVGASVTVFVATLVPGAALALALSLLASAVLAPAAALAAGRRGAALVAPVRGEYQARLVELLNGAAELAVLGRLDDRLEALAATGRELGRAERRAALGAGVGGAVASIAGGAAVWAALVLGSSARADGTLAGTGLAVLVLTPLAAHEVFALLGPGAQLLPRLSACAGRVVEVEDRPDAIADPVAPLTPPRGPVGLDVRGLVAGWGDGPDVLSGAELFVPPGGRLVVTGPSGAGKSTLVAVLLRFVSPRAGSVALVSPEGTRVELTALRAADARSLVAWIPQDVPVVSSTVEANLRIARPDATDAELWVALSAARLDGFVASLPEGLATFVGEQGARLSGGERQRLGLARALLADRPIVIADEPTEHLDEPTASALLDDLLALGGQRTVLVVTHRRDLVGDDVPAVEIG